MEAQNPVGSVSEKWSKSMGLSSQVPHVTSRGGGIPLFVLLGMPDATGRCPSDLGKLFRSRLLYTRMETCNSSLGVDPRPED